MMQPLGFLGRDNGSIEIERFQDILYKRKPRQANTASDASGNAMLEAMVPSQRNLTFEQG